jgi:hypothetical protein
MTMRLQFTPDIIKYVKLILRIKLRIFVCNPLLVSRVVLLLRKNGRTTYGRSDDARTTSFVLQVPLL